MLECNIIGELSSLVIQDLIIQQEGSIHIWQDITHGSEISINIHVPKWQKETLRRCIEEHGSLSLQMSTPDDFHLDTGVMPKRVETINGSPTKSSVYIVAGSVGAGIHDLLEINKKRRAAAAERAKTNPLKNTLDKVAEVRNLNESLRREHVQVCENTDFDIVDLLLIDIENYLLSLDKGILTWH